MRRCGRGGVHVGMKVLQECIKCGIEVALRVPNLSCKLQGEDLINFLIFKVSTHSRMMVLPYRCKDAGCMHCPPHHLHAVAALLWYICYVMHVYMCIDSWKWQ